MVHLALLHWVVDSGARRSAPAPGHEGMEAFVVRLAPTGKATEQNVAARSADAIDADAPAPRPQVASATAAAAPKRVSPSTRTLDETPSPAVGQPATPAGQSDPVPQADTAPLVDMPSGYHADMPPSVLITYTQTRQSSHLAVPEPLPDARIDWRYDGTHYALEMDGVLGKLRSEGGPGDAGVLPSRFVEMRDGDEHVTEFTDGKVLFRTSGRSVSDNIGMQDRASLLMQLAGIGLGGARQLSEVVEVVVADTAQSAVERYDVIGQETLTTPLGQIDAWHLAQRVAPGRARLDVWLVPSRGWLPLQVRLTGSDGVAMTQTVSAITWQLDTPKADSAR